MAFERLEYTMPAGFLQVAALPTRAWGSGAFTGTFNLPVLPAVSFGLWSGTGSQLGLGDAVILNGKTLTDSSPGTTDLDDTDLQAAIDLSGAAASADEVVHLLLLNDSTDDAARIVAEPGASNGWTAPFRDMTTPGDGKLSIPAGFVHPTTGTNVPGGAMLWGGNLSSMPVTGTNKVLRVRLVAGTSAAYRLVLLGRSASS